MDQQARNQVIQEIYQACKNVGFFYVAGHGVKQQAVETLFSDAQKFFRLPLEKKNALSFQNTKSQHTGYVQQRMVFQFFSVLTDSSYDWKQSL